MKLSTEGSVGDRRQVSQATEIATTVPEAIVSIGPSIPVNAIEEKVVTDTETPKSAKSDETSKDNHIKVAAKLATTPKTPSDSEGSKSNILSILATIFAAIASLALLGYGLVTGKIHLSKK